MPRAMRRPWGEVIIAAIRWDRVDSFLADAGDLAGKVLIDGINPDDFAGGLRRLISADTSTASLIQARTEAAVVKTLNHVGASVMGHASKYALRPLQFVAGDDPAAKQTADPVSISTSRIGPKVVLSDSRCHPGASTARIASQAGWRPAAGAISVAKRQATRPVPIPGALTDRMALRPARAPPGPEATTVTA